MVRLVTVLPVFVLVFAMNVVAANIPPSQSPPGGLNPTQCPQFLVIGWDDNTSSEGMKWVREFLKDKKNQAGTGNSKTFDGTEARMSFYLNTRSAYTWLEEDNKNIQAEYKALYADGHELGNHTYDHHGRYDAFLNYANETALHDSIARMSYADWKKIIAEAVDSLAAITPSLGIPVSGFTGFRVPYLEYNQHTLKAAWDAGMKYDCSIEEGYDGKFDGTNFRWPYTLDGGSPAITELGKNFNYTLPGMWELPNYVLMVVPDDKCPDYGISAGLRTRIGNTRITGFDYNLWSLGKLSKNEVLALLKYNLDLRLAGNRVPMMIGAHSQFYTDYYLSQSWADAHMKSVGKAALRAAWEEFIAYALTKSDVRIVPARDIVAWCENPSPIGGVAGPYTVSVTAVNGSVTKNPQKDQYNGGEEVILTATPNQGYVFEGWSGGASGSANPLKIVMNGDKNITASFASASNSGNVVSIAYWSASADEFGSTVDTAGGIRKDGVAKTGYKVVKQPAPDVWPWVELSASFDKALSGLTKIKITYICPHAVQIALTQEGIDPYIKTVPAASVWSTVEVAVAQFSEADWGGTKGALDLSKVKSLSFSPIVNELVDESGAISVKELVLSGVTDPTSAGSVTALGVSCMAITGIMNGSVKFNVSSAGYYCLAVYSLSGRLLAVAAKGFFPAGFHDVPLQAVKLQAGVYAVRLSRGAGGAVTIMHTITK